MAGSRKFILLTVDSVRLLRRECDELRAQRTQIDSQLADKEAKLQAAYMFLSPQDRASLEKGSARGKTRAVQPAQEAQPPKPDRWAKARAAKAAKAAKAVKAVKRAKGERTRERKPDSWTSVILRILENAGKGMSHASLMDALKKSEIGDRIAHSTKGYYGALSKLQSRGDLERVGKLNYATSVLNKLRQANAPIPEADPHDLDAEKSSKTTAGLILRTLDGTEGMTGAQLVDRLAMMPEAADSVLRHPQFVYTVLSKLVRQEKLLKEGAIYRPNVPSNVTTLFSARH